VYFVLRMYSTSSCTLSHVLNVDSFSDGLVWPPAIVTLALSAHAVVVRSTAPHCRLTPTSVGVRACN
jgi:hypothetical protein